MSRYTLHEPFPHYNHVNSMPFGRGGAGNRTSSTIPSKSRSHTTQPQQPQQQMPPNTITLNPNAAHPGPRFSTGRGGAGNMHGSQQRHDERQMFHFDEELEREKRKEKALSPVYHIGRGGEGNKVVTPKTRRGSDESSDGSEGSGRKGRRSLEWVKGLARK